MGEQEDIYTKTREGKTKNYLVEGICLLLSLNNSITSRGIQMNIE